MRRTNEEFLSAACFHPIGSTIEVGPSLLPKKKYSDISGFEAPYTEPKTKLRYASTKEYQAIQAMSQELVGARLALRGANVTKL
mmetsp:Transcript_10673/g.20126  ORF Transcript_10673/g.20126 Transcript_10673/m.20126 type:complete len:84 (+) Transcript_10673:271-522(+)